MAQQEVCSLFLWEGGGGGNLIFSNSYLDNKKFKCLPMKQFGKVLQSKKNSAPRDSSDDSGNINRCGHSNTE